MLLVLLLFVSLARAQEECRHFAFSIRFDAHPGDFALELSENGSPDIAWRRGGYDDSYRFTIISETACLDPTKCWKLTVFDSVSVQDGLTNTDGGGTGAYVIIYGNEAVGMYDAETSPVPCYERQWYRFGDGCEQGSAPNQGKEGGEMCDPDTDEDICVMFELTGMTDEFPEDTRYVLEEKDGESLWDDTPFDQTQQNANFQRVTCLDPTVCYRFTFFDSVRFPMGMTQAPEGGEPGHFKFSLNGEVVGSYNGTTDGCFQEKWFEFGQGCPGGVASGTVGPEDCNDESYQAPSAEQKCKHFQFTLFTGGYPAGISYRLATSNGTALWNDQPFYTQDVNNEYVKTICLDPDDCYTFIISDESGGRNGLSDAPFGGLPGWFSLDFGGMNIAYYDGATDGCYKSMQFSFGAACQNDLLMSSISMVCDQVNEETGSQTPPAEEPVGEPKQEEATAPGCVGFQFLIRTDEFPEDSVLLLNDSEGNLLWDERPWNQKQAGQSFDRDICLNPLDCYNFTLLDSQTHGDGLSSPPNGGVPGNFNVSFGRVIIDSYDGASDGFFSSKWYVFGDACDPETSKRGTVGDDRNIFTEQSGSDTPLSCKEFVFSISLDEFPEDVVFSLEDEGGNGTLIWEEKRPWDQRHSGDTFTESACLDPESCYMFTVEDRYADGLTDETEHGSGKFSVTWGTKILDSYRGAECYSKKWYEFGDSCHFTMGSLRQNCKRSPAAQQSAEDCTYFAFKIKADMYPRDITFELANANNESVWVEERLENSTSRSECLPNSQCYTFLIQDAFTDGLTKAPSGGQMGSFELFFGTEKIGSYSAITQGCFSSQVYTFGDGCPSFPELVAVSEVRSTGDCRNSDR